MAMRLSMCRKHSGRTFSPSAAEVFHIKEFVMSLKKSFFRRYREARLREARLQKEKKKRQDILGKYGVKGVFHSWCVLPEKEYYEGIRPMTNILFTVSLSRKYDDIYYLYYMDTCDGHAYEIARNMANKELQSSEPKYYLPKNLTPAQEKQNKIYYEWEGRVRERAQEIARTGVEIAPFFNINKNGSSAEVGVGGVVDVKEFTADGIMTAINMFLDLGEIEWKGEPIVHIVSEEVLNPTWVNNRQKYSVSDSPNLNMIQEMSLHRLRLPSNE
jgi:hypothetical protein